MEYTLSGEGGSQKAVYDSDGNRTVVWNVPTAGGAAVNVLFFWEIEYDPLRQIESTVTPMAKTTTFTNPPDIHGDPLIFTEEIGGAEYTTAMLIDRGNNADYPFSTDITNADKSTKAALRRLSAGEENLNVTKLKYKIRVAPDYAGPVAWLEMFQPDDSTLAFETIAMTETPDPATHETSVHMIDPLGLDPADTNVSRRHPQLNGTYHVIMLNLATDANRGGTLHVDASDATSMEVPYRFWLNDDIDRVHTVDDTDSEEDDIGATEAAANNWQPDWQNDYIKSKRDLEDFSRIVISTSGINDPIRTGQLFLGLKWTNVTGTPAIKLYPHIDPDGSTKYLTDESMAQQQLDGILGQVLSHAIADERDDDRIGPHTLIEGNSVFVLPTFLFANLTENNPKTYLLFEGCKAGTGQLQLVILKKDGTNFTEIGSGPDVWFDLKKIGDMYEHWSVGNSNGGAPDAVAGRIASLSGSGSAFAYTSSSPEEQKYILYVHGWNMEQWEKERYAETAYKRLWWQGYKGRFGLFSWPTTNGFGSDWSAIFDSTNFDQGEFTAWRSATPLRQLLQTLNTAYGGELYVLSHSMGGIVTSEALRLQSDANGAHIAKVYVASQAALSAHVYDGTLSDVAGSTNALQWHYTHPRLHIAGDYGPDTPNIYKNWTAFVLSGSAVSSSAVTRLVNFYNENDYALSAQVWQFNQITKPDYSDDAYPFRYGYSGDPSSLDDLFQKTNLNASVTALHLGSRADPKDRYEIMSFAAESRVKAFGATPNISQGISSAVDLQTIWPADDGDHKAHKWHSAEFRSTIQRERGYWKTLLSDRGFDIPTVTLP